MKRVEVIADDEDEIIEAVRRMSNNYDFVVTSGGIGPTYPKTSHFLNLANNILDTMTLHTNPSPKP